MLIPGRAPSAAAADSTFARPSVFAFYYVWYSAPPRMNQYGHWNGGDASRKATDLATPYYPLLGPYDSQSSIVLEQHMQWLRQAHVDVLIVSWWGQGSAEDQATPALLGAAAAHDLKVAFMIEPYGGESAASVTSDVSYIYRRYGSSPAFYRAVRPTRYGASRNPRGLFFLYSPSVAQNWAAAFDSLHSGPNDGIFVLRTDDSKMYRDADARTVIDRFHCDGLFNYGVYTVRSAYAGKLPRPSDYILMFAAAPGYDNSHQPAVHSPVVIGRENGKLYDDSWAPLAAQRPEWVSVVSFNEWLEGTQIEPARAFQSGAHTYPDYSGAYDSGADSAYGYLDRTAYWADRYRGGPPAYLATTPGPTPPPSPSETPTSPAPPPAAPRRGWLSLLLLLVVLAALVGGGVVGVRWLRARRRPRA